jgi:hypothetical protein
MKLYIYIALISLSCAVAVLFASAAPTASHLPTTDGLPLTQAVSHVQSVSSTRLAPKKEQEGRRQLEACQFSDGKPGTKCVGANACAGIDSQTILDNIKCGSCNGANACYFSSIESMVVTDSIRVEENSCNGISACTGHIVNVLTRPWGVGNVVYIGSHSW